MNALLRRLDYHLRSRSRRETCKRCWRENPVGFNVPDETWRAAVTNRHLSDVLCLHCFDRYATRRGVDWAASGCDFYPVPGVTNSCCSLPCSCTRCSTRRSWAWSTSRHSPTSDPASSSDTSARCRIERLCAVAKARLSALQNSLRLRRPMDRQPTASDEPDKSKRSGSQSHVRRLDREGPIPAALGDQPPR